MIPENGVWPAEKGKWETEPLALTVSESVWDMVRRRLNVREARRGSVDVAEGDMVLVEGERLWPVSEGLAVMVLE